MMTTSKHISLPTPFSSGDPVEWFRQFEICCRANDWDDETKAKKLPTLLEGEAVAVWFDLSTEEQGTYKTAKEKIVEQMAPARFVTLADFHRRCLRPGESLSVFAHELKRLLEQALPAADGNTSKVSNSSSISLSTDYRLVLVNSYALRAKLLN